MATSVQTTLSAPSLTLRDIITVMPVLMQWRNSKGRIMPLHIKSAPGTGKSMLPLEAVKAMARLHTGVPIGLSVHNPGVMTPAEVAGYVLFETITHEHGAGEAPTTERVSTYTRPTLFAVNRAITHAPLDPDADSDGFVESTLDDLGQSIYVGAMVRGQHLTRGITLLDEFDQADLEVRKTLAPLLDEGRITTHHLPVNWACWAASNRARDASGVGRGLAFLTNRVATFEVAADVDALESYFMGYRLESPDPLNATMEPILDRHGRVMRNPADVDYRAHPVVPAFIKQNQDLIYAGVPNDPNTPFLTARSLEAMTNLFDLMLRLPVGLESGEMDPELSFTDSFIPRRSNDPVEGVTGSHITRWRVFQALAGGTVGPENVAQFLANLELFDEVPTIGEIIKDPKKAKVSTKADAQFITAYVVSNAMNRKNADALMTYSRRLPESLFMNAVNNALNRDGNLLTTKVMAEFMEQHPDAMMRMLVVKARAKAAKM